MKKIINLYKKYEEIINYLLIGGLTTLINLIVYYLLISTICNPANPFQLQFSNIIAWIASIVFAFFTNKKFVFKSQNMNIKKEGFTFFLSRLLTLFLDMLLMFIFVTLLKFNDKIMKLVVQVIVIILNYIFSKFLVFKKKT